MSEFTPLSALLGGGLIGLSAALLMALEGRIAGISSMLARLLPPWSAEGIAPRLAFVLGLVAAPLVTWAATGDAVRQHVSENLPLMALAGLLVGFGSAWGNGCTSGHGVCGLARLSARSLVATTVFMAAALATVFVARHLLGSRGP
ncbi:MAG TPA: YeeE/YedE thiosulfate transporter family protein [Geminicoccaceae bacterium]|nr:YeeE/YedE thiosulfate transporter family protein [Geminicoccus sp.]HMU49919.1 YeeE/YedE thiosulfate transporter family protein [Geminicoccaceae bacterium]